MPDNNYRVHMWLTYDPTDAGALPSFIDRFPLETGIKWWNLLVPASGLPELAIRLNDKILLDCKTDIDADTKTNATKIRAFSTEAWEPGGAGQHETRVPRIIDVTVPSVIPWRFQANGNDYQMKVACRFYVES